jgi:hypothetical protein
MLKPGYNPAGGMPNYGSNGLDVMSGGPARNAGNASTYGISEEMMGLGGSDSNWLDENSDFLTEAFNTLAGGGETGASTTSGGGGGSSGGSGGGAGGGSRAGGGFAGGAGTDARKTWSFGDLANLQHRGV